MSIHHELARRHSVSRSLIVHHCYREPGACCASAPALVLMVLDGIQASRVDALDLRSKTGATRGPNRRARIAQQFTCFYFSFGTQQYKSAPHLLSHSATQTHRNIESLRKRQKIVHEFIARSRTAVNANVMRSIAQGYRIFNGRKM